MSGSDARATYEAIHAQWLSESRLAALHKTTAERLESELAALAEQQKQKSGRIFHSLDPDSVFGPKG